MWGVDVVVYGVGMGCRVKGFGFEGLRVMLTDLGRRVLVQGLGCPGCIN